MAKTYTLYRIYDASDGLLYVGATTAPGIRMYDHSRSQPWWADAAKITLEHLATPQELIEAEKAAIVIENPKHNRALLKPPTWEGKPRRAPGEGSLFKDRQGYWNAVLDIPSINGKRRQKRFRSKDRQVVEFRLAALKTELGR